MPRIQAIFVSQKLCMSGGDSDIPKRLLEKVINLKYGLLDSRNRLSRHVPSRNGNLKFSLEKPLGPPRTLSRG